MAEVLSDYSMGLRVLNSALFNTAPICILNNQMVFMHLIEKHFF